MNMCKIRIKRFAGLLFLCFFFAQYSITYAQVEIITGTITDNKGIPLPGVNILEDAGHMVQMESTSEVNRLINEFWKY